MGWYFKDENPSLGDQIIVHSLVVSSFSLIFGMWVDFVPEDWVIRLGSYISIIPGIAGLYWIIQQIFFKKTLQGMGFSRFKVAGVIVGAPFFAYLLSWVFLVHTVPALYTYGLGINFSQVAKAEKQYRSSTKECAYQLKSDILKGAFPSHLCIGEKFYNADFSHVKFFGKRSSAGKLLRQIQTFHL